MSKWNIVVTLRTRDQILAMLTQAGSLQMTYSKAHHNGRIMNRQSSSGQKSAMRAVRMQESVIPYSLLNSGRSHASLAEIVRGQA